MPMVQGLTARAEYPVWPWVLCNLLHSPESIQEHIAHSQTLSKSVRTHTHKARASGSGLHFLLLVTMAKVRDKFKICSEYRRHREL